MTSSAATNASDFVAEAAVARRAARKRLDDWIAAARQCALEAQAGAFRRRRVLHRMAAAVRLVQFQRWRREQVVRERHASRQLSRALRWWLARTRQVRHLVAAFYHRSLRRRVFVTWRRRLVQAVTVRRQCQEWCRERRQRVVLLGWYNAMVRLRELRAGFHVWQRRVQARAQTRRALLHWAHALSCKALLAWRRATRLHRKQVQVPPRKVPVSVSATCPVRVRVTVCRPDGCWANTYQPTPRAV